MNFASLAQLDPSQLPPAVQWLVYMGLAVAAASLLKRSVDRLDKSIERLETAVNGITEKLVRLDEKWQNHDEKIKKLETSASKRR